MKTVTEFFLADATASGAFSMFGKQIKDSIRTAGTLPEELADLLALSFYQIADGNVRAIIRAA